MNIFFLDRSATLAAQYHCDKHVVAMVRETAQILSTAHRVLDPDQCDENFYRKTHVNHPSSAWARGSMSQYVWTWKLLVNLCKEYTARYNKVHAVEKKGMLTTLARVPKPLLEADDSWVDPPQCMPDRLKGSFAVLAYRRYYVEEKIRFAKWKNGPPHWWPLTQTRGSHGE